MKVVCERQALLAAVNHVASVVPLRSPSAAMSCLKIVATKTGGISEMTLLGTDAETSIQLSFSQVDVSQPGTAVIPAEKIRQIVQAVESAVTLTIEAEGDVCHIKGEGAKFKIFAYPADQFPAIPEFSSVAGGGPSVRSIFTHSAGAMLTLINRTVFATARETSRYAINGVLLKREGKKLEMVATDGRRLALCRSTLKGEAGAGGGKAGDGATSCIVPSKALNMFTRVASNPEETVRVVVTENRVFFAFEEAVEEKGKTPRARAVLSSALVEGAFPPYEEVIPRDQDKKITAAREELIAAVREASILTNEESRGVRMSFSAKKKELRLTSRAPEMGESEIDVTLSAYEGDDLEISFNPQFLADALKMVDEPEVMIELKAANKPGVMRAGNEFVYVVMPVNLPA
ncbi:MAG: DNA polymerase III subunit beta [Phycisphaerales bacterium]